jgi:hypothetical protein
MDSAQIQGIEQALNYILNQGPDALTHLITILETIKNGAGSLGAIAMLILQAPAFAAIADQLLALIGSGATIVEIAKAIADLAATVGISTELIIQLLELLGHLILLF